MESPDEIDPKDLDMQGNGDEGTQKKKRARANVGDRNYTCGCGKAYLSYPALYTHIKTKHDGVTPSGTSQPQSSGKTGRGRPKKEESGKRGDDDQQDSQDAQAANETVLNFLRVVGNELKYDDQVETKDSNAIVSNTLDSFDMIKSFPQDILSPQDTGPILQELDNLIKTKSIGPEELDPNTDVKKTTLNKIIAFFVYIIGRHIRPQFFRELCFFAAMYRKALNELGWQYKAEFENIPFKDNPDQPEFCALNNGEYAPDICNAFITEKWPYYFDQYKPTNFKVLGNDLEKTKNTVFWTQHFCNWLNNLRYTNSRLAINED